MSCITTLCENTAAGKDLIAEHGLSFWIEHNNHHILFDTGQGFCLKHNTGILNIPLADADAIVLSHGHFDHTGGLPDALEAIHDPRVFLHPGAMMPRYICRPSEPVRAIGIPRQASEMLEENATLVLIRQPKEVCCGIFVTGSIPRKTDFEDSGGPFFFDEACQEPDTFPDDQSLYFETSAGTVVVLGCAHAGIVNTLMYILELTQGRPIHAIIGGTHLVAAGEERMCRTLDYLRGLGMQRLHTAHCTGFVAMTRLYGAFPEQYAPCPVGTILHFND